MENSKSAHALEIQLFALSEGQAPIVGQADAGPVGEIRADRAVTAAYAGGENISQDAAERAESDMGTSSENPRMTFAQIVKSPEYRDEAGAYIKNIIDKRFKAERQEKEEAKASENQRRAQRTKEGWENIKTQAAQMKRTYPAFDLPTEMSEPKFVKLIAAGVPVRDAYEVVHKDRIRSDAMAYALQKSRRDMTEAVAAAVRRPVENGGRTTGASVSVPDPRSLSQADRESIKRRVRDGEKIIW